MPGVFSGKWLFAMSLMGRLRKPRPVLPGGMRRTPTDQGESHQVLRHADEQRSPFPDSAMAANSKGYRADGLGAVKGRFSAIGWADLPQSAGLRQAGLLRRGLI
jgi:hypothetical protein